MITPRIILVALLSLTLAASNAWCACCALVCAETGVKIEVIPDVDQKQSCCQKAGDPRQQQSPANPDDPRECGRCAGMVSDDATKSAIKPANLQLAPLSPFAVGEVFPSTNLLAAAGPCPAAVAHCDNLPSTTLLALQCALNL